MHSSSERRLLPASSNNYVAGSSVKLHTDQFFQRLSAVEIGVGLPVMGLLIKTCRA